MAPLKIVFYNRGDIIRYRTFGTDIRTVLVTDTHADIKKGRPGFDGLTVPGAEPVWGYDSQIVEVVKHSVITIP